MINNTADLSTPNIHSSNGFWWAMTMFGLMFIEALVLIDAFAREEERVAIMQNAILHTYVYVSLASVIVQLIGIILVEKRWYRLGGILQIAASTIHIWEVEGIIGIIGGLDAYHYPASQKEATLELEDFFGDRS
jgi:hypothetical protein